MPRVAWFALMLEFGCARQSGAGPAAATRVVSQVVFADEVLFELGEATQARVIGVSALADDSRYSAVATSWPPTVSRIGGGVEAIVAARPDLVVLADFSAAETRAALADLDIATLTLSGFNGFADYRSRVRELSAAVDATDAGERVIAAFDRRLAELGRAPAADATVVSWQGGSTAGANTIFADISQAAGMTNVAAAEGWVGHVPLALERLVAWNPAYVVVPCDAPPCQAVEREVAAQPGVAATRAAREGGVIAAPSRFLYSTGSGMLDLLALLVDRSGRP